MVKRVSLGRACERTDTYFDLDGFRHWFGWNVETGWEVVYRRAVVDLERAEALARFN